jgi:transposase
MRGSNDAQSRLSFVTPEQLVPEDHPIRHIKTIVESALRELDPIFASMYSDVGRPSIPPENLLKACLLMALYSIRSERQFCERLQYDLLFKWFLDLHIDDPSWDQSSFARTVSGSLNTRSRCTSLRVNLERDAHRAEMDESVRAVRRTFRGGNDEHGGDARRVCAPV